jgi:hypothetical protein
VQSFHDDESIGRYGSQPAIASVSFGALNAVQLQQAPLWLLTKK